MRTTLGEHPMSTLVRLFLALFIGVAVVGCGSAKKDSATPTSTRSASSDDADDEPTNEPSADSDDDAGADEDEVAASDDDLRSFHYVVNLDMQVQEGEGGFSGTIEGDYVSPDRHAFSQTYGFSGLTLEENYILIGEDAWTKAGNGEWEATTADDPEVVDALDLTSGDPDFFVFDEEFVDDI